MSSGGWRPGAKRTRKPLSAVHGGRLLKVFKKTAQEAGQDVLDLLAELAYGKAAYEVTTLYGKKVRTQLFTPYP